MRERIIARTRSNRLSSRLQRKHRTAIASCEIVRSASGDNRIDFGRVPDLVSWPRLAFRPRATRRRVVPGHITRCVATVCVGGAARRGAARRRGAGIERASRPMQ